MQLYKKRFRLCSYIQSLKILPRSVRSWRLGNGRTGGRRMKERKEDKKEGKRKKEEKNYRLLMEILQATG